MSKRFSPNGNGIPNKEEVFGALYEPGTFFMFGKIFMFMMTHHEAILLGFLLNFYASLKLTGNLKKEWFYCTTETIEREINFDRNAQTRTFRGLKSLGFISTKKAGIPARRFIKIHKDVLTLRVASTRLKHDAKYEDENSP